MDKIQIQKEINYIGVFLTFACKYRCRYCINNQGVKADPRIIMKADKWVTGLNRLTMNSDLPITLQGGEPTLHPEFYSIVNGVDRTINIDLLTNLDFNIGEFMHNVDPKRMKRVAKYASIRVSYHHGQVDYEDFIKKIQDMRLNGFSIGVFEINRPDMQDQVAYRKAEGIKLGIDWRVKEYLGQWKGKLYGTYKYPDSIDSINHRHCLCRTTEILIDPSGFIFRCHADLYGNRNPICHILSPEAGKVNFHEFKQCNMYGTCNACDIKSKTNRFQVYGHSSVEIKNISKPYNIV